MFEQQVKVGRIHFAREGRRLHLVNFTIGFRWIGGQNEVVAVGNDARYLPAETDGAIGQIERCSRFGSLHSDCLVLLLILFFAGAEKSGYQKYSQYEGGYFVDDVVFHNGSFEVNWFGRPFRPKRI